MKTLFIVEFSEVLVFSVGIDHRVGNAGELVGGGLDGELWAVFGLDPSVVGTESAFAVVKTSGSKSQGVCCTVGRFLGFGVEDLSSRDFVVGT